MTATWETPFAAAFEPTVGLPPAFARQFNPGPDTHHALTFEGRMDRVWRRHAWLRPMFLLLAWTNTLFPETGVDIPATMTITSDGVTQTWRRTFTVAPDRVRRFEATVALDPRTGRVSERMGPRGILAVDWAIRTTTPHRIVIQGHRMRLRLGSVELRIPRLLSMEAVAIETVDPVDPEVIRIDLQVSNPMLGPVFGYGGRFRQSSVPI